MWKYDDTCGDMVGTTEIPQQPKYSLLPHEQIYYVEYSNGQFQNYKYRMWLQNLEVV